MNYPLANEAHRYKELRERLLAAMPELADDPECLIDTLDGESDIKEQLADVLRAALKAEADAEGVENYIKKLADRKAAKKQRASRLRAIVLNFMGDIGLKKIDAPDLTASVRNTPAGLSIYDESQIPEDFCRVKTEADKTAIKLALKEGKQVPGCQLGNAGQTLAIKV